MTATPSVFEGIALRSIVKYRNLSEYSFSDGEIEWLVREVKKLSKRQRTESGAVDYLCRRYGMSFSALRGWISLSGTTGTARTIRLQQGGEVLDEIGEFEVLGGATGHEEHSVEQIMEVIRVGMIGTVQRKEKRKKKSVVKANRRYTVGLLGKIDI
jgi:hypothetical protein